MARHSGVPGLDAEHYDEFAIGWNEVFDPQEEPAAEPSSAATALALPEKAAGRRALGSKSRPMRAPLLKRSGSGSDLGAASWAGEVLTSKKPPPYLRISGGKQSYIEQGMKERMNAVPVQQLRRLAEDVEPELDRERLDVAEAHLRRRKEARRSRRLQRRCRVRENEDLDALQELYGGSEHLLPLPDPMEGPSSRRPPLAQCQTKDFFVELGRRRAACSKAALTPRAAPSLPQGSGAEAEQARTEGRKLTVQPLPHLPMSARLSESRAGAPLGQPHTAR